MKGTIPSHSEVKNNETEMRINFLEEDFIKAMLMAGPDVKQAKVTPAAFEAYRKDMA